MRHIPRISGKTIGVWRLRQRDQTGMIRYETHKLELLAAAFFPVSNLTPASGRIGRAMNDNNNNDGDGAGLAQFFSQRTRNRSDLPPEIFFLSQSDVPPKQNRFLWRKRVHLNANHLLLSVKLDHCEESTYWSGQSCNGTFLSEWTCVFVAPR